WFPFALTMTTGLVGLPVFWLCVRGVHPLSGVQTTPISLRTVATAYPICMAASYLFAILGNIVTGALSSLVGRTAENPVASLVSGAPIWVVTLTIGFAAPIIEEVIFRKLLLERLRPFGDAAAIAFTSFAFALMHFNFSQFFYALAISAILCYIAIKTGSIATTIILHIFINLTGSVLIPTLALSGNPALELVSTTIIVGLAALGAALLVMKRDSIKLCAPEFPPSEPLTAALLYLNPGTLLYIGLCAVMFVSNILFG
ncbi:MAG: CPBP family intramembrane glutamic endopeptidase, partial [Oscillospiraceae bacterium]